MRYRETKKVQGEHEVDNHSVTIDEGTGKNYTPKQQDNPLNSIIS